MKKSKRENAKKVDILKYWELWEDFQVFLEFKGQLKNDLERCLNLLQLNWWFISNRKKQRTNLNYEVNPLLCTRHLRATMLCFMKNSFFPVKEGCNEKCIFLCLGRHFVLIMLCLLPTLFPFLSALEVLVIYYLLSYIYKINEFLSTFMRH